MINESAPGDIVDIREDGRATIYSWLPDILRAVKRGYRRVIVIFVDSRTITPEQRRKVYALIGEVAEFVNGYRTSATVEEAKRMLKLEFMLARMEGMERRIFSLADCDVTTAREFIDFIVQFIIENGIPTKIPLIEQAEDIGRYVYACLANKKCAVCGRPAQLHHVEGSRVGMGNDRREISHLGRECLPLCAEHHQAAHQIGDKAFMEQYHLVPVKIDRDIARKYGLKTK